MDDGRVMSVWWHFFGGGKWTKRRERTLLGGLFLFFDDLLGGQRILFARLGGLQLGGVESLDVVDEVELLFLLDNWKTLNGEHFYI